MPLPVATSQRQSRLPSTSPKILVAAVYSLEWLPRITMSVLSWICGLVDGNLLWRWDVATGNGTAGGSGLEAHASAILHKAG